MKKLNLKKRLYCSVVTILSLIAVGGNNLHATEITYNKGLIPITATGFPQAQTVAEGSTITISDMGVTGSDYVLLGWNTMAVPLVNSLAMETMVTKMGKFYAIGDLFTVDDTNLNLYAVWAIDQNSDGISDYGCQLIKPTLSREMYERIMSDLEDEMSAEDDGVSLRSLPVWNNNYDLTVLNDSAYYVGCTYLPEYENLIYFNPIHCFQGQAAYIDTVMSLVIEYDGVLNDNSMIGGKAQKALDTIKITPAMVGMEVKELFANYPFMFNSIKEDGQGILTMHFRKSDGTHPTYGAAPGSNIRVTGTTWGKPFYGNSTPGSGFDTLTIKFNIYNKPEFKSTVISQRVDTAGYIDLKRVSGTPLKYMMRCINDFRWRPANTPLTRAEQEEIWSEGANICLREMDRSIGYQQVEILYFQSNEFNIPSSNPNYFTYRAVLFNYYYEHCNDSIWTNYFVPDPLYLGTIKPTYDMFMATPGFTHQIAIQLCISAFEGSLLVIDTHFANAVADANSLATAMMPAYGRYLATQVVIPTSCRGTNCFAFESKPQPTIRREVFIPQTAGVTTDPEYGTQYVSSQEDFHFTAKYTAKPLKVTTNRLINGAEEELIGQLNTNGAYEYVIQRVTQNIVLTFGPETVANASIGDGTTIWSHNNTIYIRVEKKDLASIYSIAGQMVKSIELSEGENAVPMERGVYIVTLKDGSVHKVSVK